MEKNKHTIFGPTECIPEEMLLRYVNGQLTSKEKHFVEKHMLGCEMCADAAEGVTRLKNPSHLRAIVEELNLKIRGRSDRKPVILWLDARVKVAVAAGVVLLIGFIFLFNYNLDKSGADKTVSDNSFKGSETESTKEITGKDSERTPDLKSASGKISDEDKKENQSSNEPVSTVNRVSEGDELKGEEKHRKVSGLSYNDVPKDDRSKNEKTVIVSGEGTSSGASQAGPKTKTQEDKDMENKKSKEDKSNLNPNDITAKTEVIPQTYDQQEDSKQLEGGLRKEEIPQKSANDSGKKLKFRKKILTKNAESETEKKPGYFLSTPNSPAPVQNQTGNAGGSVNNNANTNNTTLYEYSLLPKSTVPDSTVVLLLDSVSLGSTRSDESEGAKRYRSKDYNNAVKEFTAVLKTNPDNREALYYLGASYLQLDKTDLAIKQFDQLISKGKGRYYDDALYGKSVALLKQGKKEDAKKVLNQIILEDGPYKSKAVDLEKK